MRQAKNIALARIECYDSCLPARLCGTPPPVLCQEGHVHYTVGLKLKGRSAHRLVDAEDALIAALKTKSEHPDARITYVRPQNRRGDARHPPLTPQGV